MNAEMTPAMEQMLDNVKKTGDDVLDYPPGWNHDYGQEAPVTPGSGLEALEFLALKAQAGLPLNSLEAFAAQLLSAKAEGVNWAVPTPRPASVRIEYTAEISGVYTIDINDEAFAQGLSAEWHCATHCNPRSFKVQVVSRLPGAVGGLRQVKVHAAVQFQLVFEGDTPEDYRKEVLANTRVILKHGRQPLPPLPRSLESVTVVQA